MHYADALTHRIATTSPVCVGLDPVMDRLPEEIPRDVVGMADFCRGIIDAVADIAACVKPQLAYFEAHGWQGIKVFWEVCEYAKGRGLLVIADAKRGDIGSTCEAYADAYLHEGSAVDAITVNPYLGSDGVLPFVEQATAQGKGVYVLVKTSNPSSGELQDMPVGDEVLHEHVAQLTESWGMHHLGPVTNFSCVGAVVGATYPEEMKYLRTLMPHIPFLVPGYGAQGGTAADVAHAFLPDGTGAIVNSSRGILYASSGSDWRDAARRATTEMAEALRA